MMDYGATPSVSIRLVEKYAKEYDALLYALHNKLISVIRNDITAPKSRESSEQLGNIMRDTFSAHKNKYIAEGRKDYIDARMAEAADFIDKGINNGT